MQPLTAGQIREQAKKPFRFEDIPVPEWDGSVRVRAMSVRDLDAYDAENYVGSGKAMRVNRDNTRGRFLSRCIVGEDGKPLFSADEIAGWDSSIAEPLFDAALRINKRRTEDVEDAEKNSDSARNGASLSGSPLESAVSPAN